MDERDKKIWQGFVDSLHVNFQEGIIEREQCRTCPQFDKIEWTGCFLDRCRYDHKPTRE